MADISRLLQNLPDSPGVYLMKDSQGGILYIGKAVSLKNRVRQYFHAFQDSQKVRRMVAKIDSFEIVRTNSEIEALSLESNLVKRYKPFYNILLKDDKHFPYARVDLSEPYPRVQIVRRVKDDGARYFGPFLSATTLRQSLDALQRAFPLRTCAKSIPLEGLRERPCLNYQIGRCPAPCAGLADPKAYALTVKQVCDFLSGKHEYILRQLQAMMQRAADSLEFERAARLRDRIEDIRSLSSSQIAISVSIKDRDVLAAVSFADRTVVQALFVREGKIIHTERFFMEQAQDETPGAVLQSFMEQFYSQASYIPREILTSHAPPEAAALEGWLGSRRGGRVHMNVPQRGEKRKLVKMAADNALLSLEQDLKREERDRIRRQEGLKQLQEALALPTLPMRIEAFDISNIQGTDAVGSMVVLEDGRPARKGYRRFRIKGVQGQDDFASMAEVIGRRLGRLAQEGEGGEGARFGAAPDLILIDGGRGQLSAALEAMRAAGFSLPMAGLAKQYEEIYLPGRAEPLRLPRASGALLLLQRVRDEAHRFALSYHRSLRQKRGLLSELQGISGIGERRRRALLMHFGSLKAIEAADTGALAQVDSMTRAAAQAVFDHFHSPKEEADS